MVLRKAVIGLLALSVLLLCQCFSQQPSPKSRKLVLEGAANCRELGGLEVKGGRVRPGWVYRTNTLEGLTDADLTRMKGLGIRTLIDLRLAHGHYERADRPEFVRSVAHLYWLPMNVDNSPEGYRRLPERHIKQMRELFTILSGRDAYPVLYHCHAGKDRTGIVTALLLELLGAERQTILGDYLSSRDNGAEFDVRKEWLEGLWSGVDAAGGIDAYLDRLGIPSAQRQAVRSLLVVPAR